MSEKINITKDAMKAEAKIRRMRNSAVEAATRVCEKSGAREREYVSTLTTEVRAVLVAAGVLGTKLAEYSGEYIDIEGTLLEEPDAAVLS